MNCHTPMQEHGLAPEFQGLYGLNSIEIVSLIPLFPQRVRLFLLKTMKNNVKRQKTMRTFIILQSFPLHYCTGTHTGIILEEEYTDYFAHKEVQWATSFNM